MLVSRFLKDETELKVQTKRLQFCNVDTVFLPLDTLPIDSIIHVDTLRQELPKLETE